MAHIKSGGTTKGNRDSIAKRLGVKKFAGNNVISGNIIVRQKGTKFFPGKGCAMGNDYTIFAVKSGVVNFKTRLGKRIVFVN